MNKTYIFSSVWIIFILIHNSMNNNQGLNELNK